MLASKFCFKIHKTYQSVLFFFEVTLYNIAIPCNNVSNYLRLIQVILASAHQLL